VSSTPVIIISRATAARVWPGENPIGGMVRIGSPTENPWRMVVGVAGDVHHKDLTETPAPQMYLPQSQNTDSFLVLVARTASDPAAVVRSIRGGLKELDANVPVYKVATMDDLVGNAVSDRRFVMNLLAAFAVIAIVLAAIGLYGVVSYAVAQRTRELGVRLALGATPSQIAGLILGRGAALVAIGLALGLAGAVAAVRFLSTLVFGIGVTDPIAFTGAVAVLASVAIVAHWLPVRRAMHIDPADALRHE
jgi:ABC-type antimicrobial peptide transport system permease subunit